MKTDKKITKTIKNIAKTNKKTSKTTVVLIIIIVILALALAAFAIQALLPSSSPSGSSGVSAENTSKDPMVEIKTPYCTLEYPQRWKDSMSVKESEQNGVLAETFYAVISGKEYALYTVYFGDALSGDLYGYLPYEDTNVAVHIECHKLAESAGLSEEEAMQFYEMIEGVNEIALSISAAPGYFAP